MAAKDSNALERVYQSRIGEASTASEVYGYWLFVLGLLAGLAGIALVMMSADPGTSIRGGGIALAALGLVLLLVGQIIRLPLKRSATTLSLAGAGIAVLAVAWFVVAFNAGNWGSAFGDSESLIIGLYGLGVLVMAAGSILTPLVTGRDEEQAAAEARAGEAEAKRDAAMDEIARQDREDNQNVHDARKEQAAAETRAGEAEAKRDAAMDEITRQDREDNQNVQDARKEQAAAETRAGEAEAKRDAAREEIDRRDEAAAAAVSQDDDQSDEPADSQSQFKLYTDKSGEYRWRLRHDNGNIIADGSEGYSSRRNAMQGIRAVKRDAVEATVQDLDEMDGDEGGDEVLVGDDDQSDEPTDSQSQFELYTDRGGEYRWRLRHENSNIIADGSEGYSSRRDAMQGIRAVKRDAVEATVQDLDEMGGDENADDEVLVGDDDEQ